MALPPDRHKGDDAPLFGNGESVHSLGGNKKFASEGPGDHKTTRPQQHLKHYILCGLFVL